MSAEKLREAASLLRSRVARTEPHHGAPIEDCPHCIDGHRPFSSKSWGAFITEQRDGDGQPQTIHVCRSAGEHVAPEDANTIWRVLEIGMHPDVALFAAEWLDQAAEWREENPGDAADDPNLSEVNDPALVFALAYLGELP